MSAVGIDLSLLRALLPESGMPSGDGPAFDALFAIPSLVTTPESPKRRNGSPPSSEPLSS
jgi:hypothetical protein